MRFDEVEDVVGNVSGTGVVGVEFFQVGEFETGDGSEVGDEGDGVFDGVGDGDGEGSYPRSAMGHELALDAVEDLVGFLVRRGNGNNVSGDTLGFVLGATMDEVSKEEVEALNHDLAALLLVRVVLQIVDATGWSDPLLAITGVAESRQSSLNRGAGY